MLTSIKSRHENLSWADLIVLAGITALEDAADRWVRLGDELLHPLPQMQRHRWHLLPGRRLRRQLFGQPI